MDTYVDKYLQHLLIYHDSGLTNALLIFPIN